MVRKYKQNFMLDVKVKTRDRRRGTGTIIVLEFKGIEFPQYRMPLLKIQAFREQIYTMLEGQLDMPYSKPIELSVLYLKGRYDFVSHMDLSNIIQGLCQAMDGTTLSEPHILKDDGQIISIRAICLDSFGDLEDKFKGDLTSKPDKATLPD